MSAPKLLISNESNGHVLGADRVPPRGKILQRSAYREKQRMRHARIHRGYVA
jgi:hypothetical protein